VSLALYLVALPLFAETPEEEYTRKAKIIRTLIGMVGWPDNALPANEITVCVAGQIPYMKQISSINGTTALNKPITVKKIETLNDVQNQCQIIYLYQLSNDQLDAVIKQYEQKPVLLIGDMDSFALRGGSMNFTFLNNTLAITVNMDRMKSTNLHIDLKAVDKITVIPEAKDLSE
jgi:hypothetical protein